MKKKIKIGKKHIIFVVLAVFALICVWYTRPAHIQDELSVVNIDNGERHQVKIDIYRKKSLVRPTVFYGSVWVDETEYTCSYEKKGLLDGLSEFRWKIRELFHAKTNIGTFYNAEIEWPTEEYSWPTDDVVWIANYKSEGVHIRMSLSGDKCSFSTGTYLDEESAERWRSGGAD